MVERAQIETFVIAAAGVIAFRLFNLPLPFLFGPLFFCLFAALTKRPLMGFGQFSVAARTILGVAVGASVTPDLYHRLPEMAVSVALIPVYIVLIAFIGMPFLQGLRL